jgi:hypothetical protein
MRRRRVVYILLILALLLTLGSSAQAPNEVTACGSGPLCSCSGPGVECGKGSYTCVAWGCRWMAEEND